MTNDVLTNTATPLPRSRHGLVGYIPLAVFLIMAVFFGIGLTMNPRDIPSPLIGKPAPQFSLPPVKGRTLGFSTADLKGQVTLVNVFASWCVACREEHPLWMQLKRMGIVPIFGLNYKDKPDDAQAWLDELGDPFTRTGADISGRVAIDWGVYGVPETFLVDRNGIIVYKQIGAITPKLVEGTIIPLIRKLQTAG